MIASLDEEITALKASITRYESMLEQAETSEERIEVFQTITARRQNLERLYTQLERQQQTAGKIFVNSHSRMFI
jgi:predicted RNase H-like nuclease (RuvC/YqgF family)